MKGLRILLVIIAVVCIGVAVSYPIRYYLAMESNNSELEELSAMRKRVQAETEQTWDDPPRVEEPGEAGTSTDGDWSAETDAAQTSEAGEVRTSEADARQTSEIDAAEPVDTAGDQSFGIGVQDVAAADAAVSDGTEAHGGTSTADGTSTPIGTSGPDDASISDGASTTDETSAPSATDAPVETSAQGAMPTPVETLASAETPVPDEAATPVGTASTEGQSLVIPEDTTLPEDAVVSADTAVPADATPTPALTPGPTLPPGATPTPVPSPTPTLDIMDLIINDPEMITPTPSPTLTPTPSPTPVPSPTPDRSIRTGALAYEHKEKVELDESKILPELREIYALNHDLVGWIFIDDTLVDYPVVQTEDSQFYLKHDFYGKNNANGQIILDTKCDPYTPSYNLVISGHHMNSGAMFGRLPRYKDKKYWETHKIVEFDTLMARKRYVIFAVFYSADYDVDEEGFRYNADIQYKIDADLWLAEIEENQIFDTGIDAEFGDEFITLTTCERSRRRDGRFVVVARRIREGEIIQ